MHRSARDLLMAKAARSLSPLSGTFELTARCNMNCKMCYIRMSESELAAMGQERTAEEWLALGKEAAKAGALFLLLTGGEPLLRPDFANIYQGLRAEGLYLSINTNGTLVDRRMVELLRHDRPTAVNITVYGTSNATYARLCGHPLGYDLAVRAIQRLQDADIPVTMNISLTRENAADFPGLFALSQELKVPVRVASYMFPPVRRAQPGECHPVRFSAEECGALRAASVRLQLGEQFAAFQQAVRRGAPAVLPEESDCVRDTGEPMGCMAGRSSFWVTWDGRMLPCGMMNTPAAMPFADGFAAAWRQITQQTGQIRLPAECRACSAKEFCHPCGAMVQAENDGDFTKRPAYLCASTAAYLQQLCKIEQGETNEN